MQVELLNDQGKAASNVEVPDTVFGRDYNEALIHQLVVAYQANARQGTRGQKGRDTVKHSTKKPYRQKGTGNARAGMTSSPIWRGGGRAFPNSPDENFTQKLNKKMYRAGMASIFSQLVREGRLSVVDNFKVDAPKTKLLADKFKAMNLKSDLVIADQVDENLYLASRNLPQVFVLEPRYADPLSLVHYKKVIVTKAAIDKLQLADRTATGEAIFTSLQAIATVGAVIGGGDGPPPARIVLMSDGKETVPSNPDNPKGAFTAARTAKDQGVPISTVSFGTPYGYVDINDQRQPVPVDEDMLSKIAELSDGNHYTASSLEQLKEVFSSLQDQIGYETVKGDASVGWLRLGSAVLALAALAALLINRRLPG